jgi:mannobiose 2-epimerase
MLKRMTDQQNGGVYWSLHADGTVADATKHTYNQAFAIYALSAYFRAGKNPYALERAKVLFRMIEDKCRDAGGYLEAFTADWRPESNEKLSENGVMATRTMNTLLHVMEGYTGLYQVWSDPELKARLYEILDIWESKIYNKEKRRQEVFFDHEYHSLIDLHSFGHDIETSWLSEKTLEALDDPALTARIRPRLLEMADHTWHDAFTDHGFANECERGVVNQKRIWWVQAEALMGFLNAWEKTGETRYWDAMLSQWNYIRDVMTDKRTNSEWFWYVNEDGSPGSDEPIVEPWKCPYHNGRMCIEVLRRGMKEEAK